MKRNQYIGEAMFDIVNDVRYAHHDDLTPGAVHAKPQFLRTFIPFVAKLVYVFLCVDAFPYFFP